MINKYPRTLHLPFSPEVHSDDKVINFKDLNNLLNKEYVVLEKMDGQNNCLKGLDTNTNNYGGVFARTHTQETQLAWDSYLINWYHQNKYNLKDDNWYFIENLFAKHSIVYENLDTYMFLFNVYNNKTNIMLSWNKIEEEAKRLNLRTPEVIKTCKFNNISEIQKLLNEEILKPSRYGKDREGFVLRPMDSFNIQDFSKCVVKYVRKGHVQTDEHWTKNWKKAKLIK